MSIYARKSLETEVDCFAILKTARETFKWFNDTITKVMPYKKIDHVLVPKLKLKAMENVGCITYDDGFIAKTQTPNQVAYFHMLIAHEM